MNPQDVYRTGIGATGTVTATIMSDAETIAAIFAGVTTGIYMIVCIVQKLRKPKAPDAD